MVQVGVDVVDTDGVDTQHLHEGSIAKAVILVAQGVYSRAGVVASRATRLVGNTHNLEAVASGVVDEERTLNIDGGYGSGQRGGAYKAKKSPLNLRGNG